VDRAKVIHRAKVIPFWGAVDLSSRVHHL
jgi:hypothetical protein